jgi:GT2 family glycosyltransferase
MSNADRDEQQINAIAAMTAAEVQAGLRQFGLRPIEHLPPELSRLIPTEQWRSGKPAKVIEVHEETQDVMAVAPDGDAWLKNLRNNAAWAAIRRQFQLRLSYHQVLRMPDADINDQHVSSQSSHPSEKTRPRVAGKFIYVGDEKLYVRGVTYGTFRPGPDGREQFDPVQVERDFAQMREAGANAVRTYTVPPRWLLDAAQAHGLYVMAGLPWEQHVAFLDLRGRAREIERRVRAGVRECAGHPALLCYAVGNEIPSPIVRWLGARRVERFLRRLYRAVKEEDAGALVTYVNYPSTEYLDLSFADFFCFNVYLESEERLDAYLARLHNLAGDRPLVMAEIGLDSRRNGERAQAETLAWQVRTCFSAGCAGAFVFAWTDEWWRGGHDIEDWDFGLVTRERQPKPALSAVARAFNEVPFAPDDAWPRVSVVVCSYNGERTIRDCMEGLARLDYPNFEVIVVNDGSTDRTARIASEYDVRLISTHNRGLSAARNTGLEAADGEIVAYTDDDARPDPHWLYYLAHSFRKYGFAAVGGPNVAPAGDGLVADCVANAPGGPVHVLLSDRVAEHIPGCNMSFRREVLQEVGGFDPVYRVAGDDVDLCWRVQERGGTLGFHPSALVWHHHRNYVRTYWRQQQGYGKAEALLEAKWPEKYNAVGHLTWDGRVYGKGLTRALLFGRGRVQHGTWGAGLFQSVYEPAAGTLRSLPLMPEWFFVVSALAALAALGFVWTPMLAAAPLLALALAAPVAQAVMSARRAQFTSAPATRAALLKLQMLTVVLHLMQPLARLKGRLRWGLTPWRRRGVRGFAWPRVHLTSVWCETWRAGEERLRELEVALRGTGATVLRGGDFDRWDLEVRGGLFGAARVLTVVEEHGAGRQLVRARSWPRVSPQGLAAAGFFAALVCVAALDGARAAAFAFAFGALVAAARTLLECGAAMSTILRAAECRAAEEARAHAAGTVKRPTTATHAPALGEATVVSRERRADANLGEKLWAMYNSRESIEEEKVIRAT